MMISFEGVSGVGKTTILNGVRAKFSNLPVWECPDNVKQLSENHECYDIIAMLEMSILDVIDWSMTTLITDRHPRISEAVYSRLCRRQSLLGDDFSRLSKYMAIIYIKRSNDVSAEQKIYEDVIEKARASCLVAEVVINENDSVEKSVDLATDAMIHLMLAGEKI